MVLFDLARAAGLSNRAPRRAAPAKVRASVQGILDATSAPTYVRNARFDILAANPACFALYSGILSPDTLPLNLARFVFLDPRALSLYLDWDTIADDSSPRSAARPDATHSTAACQISSANSPPEARTSAHDGQDTTSVTTALPSNASTTLPSARSRSPARPSKFPVTASPSLTYTAPADSHAQQQLDFLASWSTSPDADKIVAAYDERQSERHAVNINHGE